MDNLLDLFSFEGRANRAWYFWHILLDDPRFYVRTKKGTPKAAIDRAMESIIVDIAAIQKKLAQEA